MQLLLWRHADAEDGHPDALRALTRKGHAQAAATARWLQPRLPPEYRLIASPATRAQQTAAALGAPVAVEPLIDVGAHPAGVLAAAGWEQASRSVTPYTVIVVGHQPTLGRLAALLVGGSEGDWPVRKSALWWIEGDGAHAELRAVFDPGIG
jgi:phosphohistidine phosphatase